MGKHSEATCEIRSMNMTWPKVKLGDVLLQDTNYIDAPKAREYPKLSVKLYGKGVVLDTPRKWRDA